jgi:hypothetical protein
MKELLASIPERRFIQIDLDKNVSLIQWEEKGEEFYLLGELYDVKKTVVLNGKTILYCVNDVKEEQLLQEMGNAAQQGNDKSHKSKFNLKFQIKDYLLTLTRYFSVSFVDLNRTFSIFEEICLNESPEILTPPPRIQLHFQIISNSTAWLCNTQADLFI